MSGITFIRRDQNDGVNIVRIVAVDTLATVGTANYISAQSANIIALNNGAFDWLASDMVLVSASDGWGFFTISSDFLSLTPFAIVTGVTTPTIVGHIAVYDSTGGNIGEDAATAINGGNVQAGLSGTAGTLASFPATASKGSLKLVAVANTGNTNTTISNAAMGQASVISIPDPGASTANFVLDAGTASVISVANLKYGATPVAQVDPASCTIVAAAGAANTSTVTVQLKDGSGTNMARIIPFRVYASSAADGLTLASVASTGFSVASGGLSLNNGAAITTQISCMSSATGGCVLSLLDTGKQTSYLVLVLANGCKISLQLSAGSYG